MTASQSIAALEDTASRHLPFSARLTDSIVSTRNGDYMSTWAIGGLSFEGLNDDEAYAKMESLNLLVRSLSNGKYAFWIHRIRRATADQLSIPAHGFAHDLVKKYYATLAAGGLMSTEIYLTIIHRPFPQKSGKLIGRLGKTRQDIEQAETVVVDVMENLHQQVSRTLAAYAPERLEEYTHKGIAYSRQLEFYGYLINGHWWRVPVKNLPLYKYLATARVLFGNEVMETRDTHGSVFSAFVDIKDYADFSDPGILNTMLGLPFEYVETQSFSPMHTLDARAALNLQRKRMISADDNSLSQLEQLDEAMDGVASGSFALGEYHYLMQVKSPTSDGVKAARSTAIEALQNAGFLGVPLDLVIDHAYLSQLPANWRSRPRSAHLSSRNFSGLCSMHNFNLGKRDGNPWGEAVTVLRSPASQPVYFNFHSTPDDEDSTAKSALGNCQIIGQSGGGKTVLALFLMMNLYKYGTQVVFFDKDRGAEIAIRAAGGRYLSLQRGRPTGFNPFEDGAQRGQHPVLGRPGQVLLAAVQRAPHAARGGRDLARRARRRAAADRAARFRGGGAEPAQRRRQQRGAKAEEMVRRRRAGLGARLRRGNLLSFDDGRSYGFDYTEILDDALTCPAVMMYLMFRIENLIDGRRFAFFMDEYWKALSISYFEDFAKNKQKTIRKQNGFGVYMTQSPSDTLRSPIARALIEQTATFIFLPNPTADYQDYVEGFKLSETEFELIRAWRRTPGCS
ncbi:VirB4 family type IV secretion/conjugal transfer ATPase [Rugamonas sp. DEMB1]|uniref:VirB4 family type IV secretion/conjugal transfer ATPase n=1 Tax=Rugamonas sp. DEMB1 TaxID=3039386 RepID=UPI002448F399|nr:VirB4 family type IV secretion/conjugal transfer ATPase [Rugamonas sp. DEMB1]WGG49412.1 VirB4 family type IV secretion/conjugal transfer ATPase [Rugamonas sp. DEMB1]